MCTSYADGYSSMKSKISRENPRKRNTPRNRFRDAVPPHQIKINSKSRMFSFTYSHLFGNRRLVLESRKYEHFFCFVMQHFVFFHINLWTFMKIPSEYAHTH